MEQRINKKDLLTVGAGVMMGGLLSYGIMSIVRGKRNWHLIKAKRLIANIKNETNKYKRKRLLDQFYQEALLYNNSRVSKIA